MSNRVGEAPVHAVPAQEEGTVLATARHFRFGTFEFHTSPARLTQRGQTIKARPQALYALELLLSRAGQTVSREEMREHLWGSKEYVDHEAGINNALQALRKALGDDPQSPAFIETVPRQGYRFIAQVELSETPLVSLQPVKRWPPIAVVGAVLVTVIGISVLWGRLVEAPADSRLPRLTIQPLQGDLDTSQIRPSAASLTDELLRVLLTEYGDHLDLAVASPPSPGEGPAANGPPREADYLVLSTIAVDGNGDYTITSKLVQTANGTIVWAGGRSLPAAELASWPALAAADIVGALTALPARAG